MNKKYATNKYWSYFYNNLMNGLRPMIPFVAGGGILMAISFMIGGTNPDTTNELAKMLYFIGHDNAMVLLIPVFAGYISYSISGQYGLAAGMVGGMIAKNTGSGFLGGIIAGFLAGFIVNLLLKILVNFPQNFESIKKLLVIPVISVLITGILMCSIVGLPIAWMNTTLTQWINSLGTENLIITGLILGGMMAVDLGGPINKVAYIFAVSQISNGNYYLMAAVMAGGVVPPLGVALATTLFKQKFTIEEQTQGKTYYLLGASFITESCMPVALADPLRIIPAGILGSAIAGALTMYFYISLPAPHGGLFVIPIIEGGLMPKLYFLLSIILGTLISALSIGLTKKNKIEVSNS